MRTHIGYRPACREDGEHDQRQRLHRQGRAGRLVLHRQVAGAIECTGCRLFWSKRSRSVSLPHCTTPLGSSTAWIRRSACPTSWSRPRSSVDSPLRRSGMTTRRTCLTPPTGWVSYSWPMLRTARTLRIAGTFEAACGLKRAFGDVSIDFFLMRVLVPRSVPRPVLIALLVTGAVSVFTIGSVLCSLSTWLWSFIAARVLQGTGGAAGGTAFQRKA